MGRPTKLSDKVQRDLLDALGAGAYLDTAAHFAGIHPATFHRWLKTGANLAMDLENDKPIPPERMIREEGYLQFREAVKAALSRFELGNLATIQSASKKQWQAAAWLLERRFTDRYGRTIQKVEHATEAETEDEKLGRLLDDPKIREHLFAASDLEASLELTTGGNGAQVEQGGLETSTTPEPD